MTKSKKSRSRSSSSSSSSSSTSDSSSSSSSSPSSGGKNVKKSSSRKSSQKTQNSHSKAKSRVEQSHRSRNRSRSRDPYQQQQQQHHQQQQSKWDSPDQRKRHRSESRGPRDSGGVQRGRERRDDSRERRGGRREDRHEQRMREDTRHQTGSDRSRYNERRQRSRSRSPRRNRDDRYPSDNRGRRNYQPSQRSDSKSRPQASQSQQQRNNDRRRRRNSRDDENKTYEWGKRTDDSQKEQQSRDDKSKRGVDSADGEPIEKEKPNFALSGALTEDTNKVNGVVVKYSEPVEARKPKRRWRLYPFKGETALPTLHIHRQSCFLVGRDRKVVDLAVDHPSCSKQHAALQYRLVPFEREDGTQGKRVRLYLIDLDSANGTFLNNKKIDARKYYELMEKDVIKFGFSSREYVLLHENSKEDQEDDDIEVKQEAADGAPAAASAPVTP